MSANAFWKSRVEAKVAEAMWIARSGGEGAIPPQKRGCFKRLPPDMQEWLRFEARAAIEAYKKALSHRGRLREK